MTLATLKAQIGELAGRASPQGMPGAFVQITPQTVAGTPGLIYGLLHNDALIASKPENVGAYQSSGGYAYVVEFDTAHDVLQIESRQAANFGALHLTQSPANGPGQTGYARVDFGGGATITLYGVHEASLTAANFRFV